MQKKLAIIGASYLQKPLVEKAKDMGIETHVFAWKEGCVVEDIADFFYPISILDKNEILEKCKEIKIDGITSIASDIAMPTVNFVAFSLGLVGNSLDATKASTNKYEMRLAQQREGIKHPVFHLFKGLDSIDDFDLSYPVIVKPVDRSGSRGVTKVMNVRDLHAAVKKAISLSFEGACIVEEFISGREYSVESISYKGKHNILAVTEKVTSGSPFFVETEHHQPAKISNENLQEIKKSVEMALDAISIENGASHSEIFLSIDGDVQIGEVAGRMGGDLIGSDLVKLSTGFDYVKAVIEIALDMFDAKFPLELEKRFSGVYYLTPKQGKIHDVIDNSEKFPEVIRTVQLLKKNEIVEAFIDSSSKRAGAVVYASDSGNSGIDPEKVLEYKTKRVEA